VTWGRQRCDGLTGGGAERDRAIRRARTAETAARFQTAEVVRLRTAEAALLGSL
jgi:hypothetical protein